MSLALVTICACNQHDLEGKDDQTVVAKTEVEIDGVKCKDGILHFPSIEKYIEVTDNLSNSPSTLAEFENKYNFKSLTTTVEDIFDEIIACNSQDMLESVVNFYSDKVKMESDHVVPRIMAPRYTNIANADGIFYIDGVKHQVFENEVEITNSSVTKSDEETVKRFNYIESTPIITKAEEGNRFVDVQYQGGSKNKRKVFARADVIRYTAQANNETAARLVVRIHTSAQIKNIFGWNSYKTGYSLDRFACKIEYDRRIVTKGELTINSDGGDQSNYIFEIEAEPWQYYGVYRPSRDLPPFPAVARIKFRAISGGTAPCGAVSDYIDNYTIAPITQCR